MIVETSLPAAQLVNMNHRSIVSVSTGAGEDSHHSYNRPDTPEASKGSGGRDAFLKMFSTQGSAGLSYNTGRLDISLYLQTSIA
jgi:hypothetical protein